MRHKGWFILIMVNDAKYNVSQGYDKAFFIKVRGPFVQTLCIEKDSYMDAI